MDKQTVDTGEFMTLAQQFRPELMAHCYRMLGSVADAEDLVQETYLQAWRGFGQFEGRSSLRHWLYRIATNACLRALEQRSRRPLPSGLSGPGHDPEQFPGQPTPGMEWLEPIPDRMLAAQSGMANDPASIVEVRGSVRLALMAAMQLLPARQRAVLILREVLEFSAAETGTVLGTTAAAVNSALQRARAALAEAGVGVDEVVEPPEPQRRALVDRYVQAIESADFDAVREVLREDALLEMPPSPVWFAGRDPIVRFLQSLGWVSGTHRMVRVGANGQSALGQYRLEDHGHYRAHSLQVLALTEAGIGHIVAFFEPSLFPAFGLELVLHGGSGPGASAGS